MDTPRTTESALILASPLPLDRPPAAVQGVRGEKIPTGRELTGGEISALMAACEADDTPAGSQDAAPIGLLYGSGLPRAKSDHHRLKITYQQAASVHQHNLEPNLYP